MDVPHQFGQGGLPNWLDILDGPRADNHNEWQDGMLSTSDRWDSLHHEFGRERFVSDNMVSLTLSMLGLTDHNVLYLPGNLGQNLDTL